MLIVLGAYQYQFTTSGDFYYWSGIVNPAKKISMRGVIRVKPRAATSKHIEVKVNGQSAIYEIESGKFNI